MKRKFKKRYILLITGGLFLWIVVGSYVTWNRLDPEFSCAHCHEVAPSHQKWQTSAHAGVSCTDCHGTALSEGFHSLKEKTGMLFTHLTENKKNEDIHLTERQVLALSDRCIQCHQSEHAGWLESGHAVNYREIFMDSTHNAMERPYPDCFRCHGMFYDNDIHTLMELDGAPADWKIKEKRQELLPTVPCLACHQIHTENPVSMRYVSAADSSKKTRYKNPRTALYVRADKMHLRSDKLTPVNMVKEDGEINKATDPTTLLCMQCHAPDYQHRVGSQDDRTPVGIHEGISCVACHRPHSGDTRESCIQCHSSLTDEQIKAVSDDPHGYVGIHRKMPTLSGRK